MTASSRRYLSVWLRRLATDRITKRSATPAEAQIVVAPVKGALRLSAVNDAAAALGLKVGMPLADARAMHPRIAVAEADAQADLALLEAIADWCDRYTPLVGLDPPDGLMLDITGCAHLFGGEAALARDLTQRLGAQGYQARGAVAETVGCAWAAARFLSLPRRGRVVAEGDRVGAAEESDVLSPLPLAALRLPDDVIEALAQVGLRRIADVIERPRAPLAARFGEAFVRRLDQALGRADEPIMPRLPVPPAMAEQRFAEPVAREDDVLGTIEKLAARLGAALERRGEGARLLQAALFRADGKVFRIEAGTAAPLREPSRIRRLFAERLAMIGDECDPGFGFDVVRLAALVTERAEPAQTGLDGSDHTAELAHLIDRLGARFGLRRVTRLMEHDTHIPEFAVMAIPAHMARHAAVRGNLALAQDSPSPTRPIRLFERPEPIETIAEVPDGPPAQFTWRRIRHIVLHVEGPERIATEWWHDETGNTLMRDYFRVETHDGLRVWIFRSWPKSQTQEEKEDPKQEFVRRRTIGWFVHGVFA